MARALVEIIGDAESFIRSLRKSAAATDQMSQTLKGLKVTAETTARAEIDAIVRKQARQRAEITVYKEVAATAVRGSREQVAAANLAAAAEARLSRSLGVSASESRRLSVSARGVERDFSRLGRGAVAGSLGFNRFGRAISYASGYLLASGGLVFGLKAATQAAIEHQQREANLGNAIDSAGLSFAKYRGEIDDTLRSQRQLSGFTEEDTTLAFTKLVRTTKDVGAALRYTAIAANLARGANTDLATASNAINKALVGTNTSLHRTFAVEIPKGVTGYRAIQLAAQKYAGGAAAYAGTAAGAQARLTQAIHETEVSIGTALLPTITKYSNELSDWLNKSENQKRVQRDVATAVKDLAAILRTAAQVIRTVTGAVGGLKNALEILLALKVASALSGVAGSMGLIGARAATSEGKVSSLKTSLAGLGALQIAPIVIPIGIKVEQSQESWLKKHLGGGAADFFSGLENIAGAGVIGRNPVSQVADALFGGGNKSKPTHSDHRLRRGSGIVSGPILTGSAGGGGSSAPGLDRLQQIGQAISNARTGVARGTVGAKQDLVAALKAQIDYDRQYETVQEGLIRRRVGNVKGHAQTLQRLQSEEQSALSEIASLTAKTTKAATSTTAKEKAAAAAEKKAEAARLATILAYGSPGGALEARSKALNKIYAQQIAEARLGDRSVGSAASHAVHGFFRSASLSSLTAGIKDLALRKQIEQRIAQAQAHSGHTPTATGVLGQSVVISGDVYVTANDPKEFLSKLQRHAKKGVAQRRGPNAGTYLGLH